MAAVPTVTVRALNVLTVRADVDVMARVGQHVAAVARPQLAAGQGTLLEGRRGWVISVQFAE